MALAGPSAAIALLAMSLTAIVPVGVPTSLSMLFGPVAGAAGAIPNCPVTAEAIWFEYPRWGTVPMLAGAPSWEAKVAGVRSPSLSNWAVGMALPARGPKAPFGAFGAFEHPGGNGKDLLLSLKRLEMMDVNGLYPGHDMWVEKEGKRHIHASRAALESFLQFE